MKKIILLAAIFGVILGVSLFFSSPSITQPRRFMFQHSALPERNAQPVSIWANRSVWFTAIGFVFGGIVALGAFLVVRQRD